MSSYPVVPWSLVRALRWPSLWIPSVPRPLGGRPSAYTKETQRRVIESFLNDPRAIVAARAAGVTPRALRNWLRAHPGLRRVVAECRALARRKRQIYPPPRRPRKRAVPPPGSVPTRQMKLTAWHLARRVDTRRELNEQDERDACARFRLPWEAWQQAKRRFPGLLARVHAERAGTRERAVRARSASVFVPKDRTDIVATSAARRAAAGVTAGVTAEAPETAGVPVVVVQAAISPPKSRTQSSGRSSGRKRGSCGARLTRRPSPGGT